MASRDNLIRLEHISAAYGEVPVLSDISLTIRPGEIHALVGEHGAGKSSLALLIKGEVPIKSGSFFMKGVAQQNYVNQKADRSNICLVKQRIPLSKAYTVAENLFIGNKDVIGGLFTFFNAAAIRLEAQNYIKQHGFRLDPLARTANLNMADRALVAILRELYKKPCLLILDETLEKLSSINLIKIIPMLHQLTDEGSSVLFITHQIDDVYHIADRVSIIRHGELLLSEETNRIDKINLIRIAYTQMSEREDRQHSNSEFYQLLRYNEAILKSLPINLLVLDTKYDVKLINDTARDFFNLNRLDFDVHIEGLFQGSDKEAMEKIQESIHRKKETMLFDIPLKVNGKNMQTNFIVYPVLDGLHPLGYIIILEDITERERMREQLILSEKLAALGLLAAGVAHEINNPLGIIYNYLESLKWLTEGNQESKKLIDNLEEQFEYIANIVANLLSFSENRELSTEPFNIVSLIRELINLVRFNAQAKHIEIHFETDDRPLLVSADRNEIKQVLLNLLKNSFEALGSNGTIELTAHEMKKEGKPEACITIRDNGTGIKLENPNDIFLPFTSTKGSNSGNIGLGLSVSYNIIKKNRGSITVENLLPNGCKFSLWLPL
jgi:signal transduction histidine kinase/ABC-type branched-subunit amino acid transport system ATPase component